MAEYFHDEKPIVYSIDSSEFTVSQSGVITLIGTANYETKSSYDLVLYAASTDLAADTTNLTINCSITVDVVDVNDAPLLLDLDVKRSVDEFSLVNTFVGTNVGYVDEDVGQELTFSIVDGDDLDQFRRGTARARVARPRARGSVHAPPSE